jgi:Glycosyltransferase family 87
VIGSFKAIPALPPRSRHRLLFWLWVGVAAAAIGRNGHKFLDVLHPPYTEQQFCYRDFSQDWLSARSFLAGAPIYESLQTSVRRSFADRGAGFPVTLRYNAHPPGAVVLALSFALLDYRTAFWAWTVASLAALIASLALLSQMFAGTIWNWALLPATCLIITSYPLRESLYMGQSNCVLLLLVTSACFAQRRGAAWSAGAFLALATYLKLFPGLFFLALLLKRDYKSFTAGLVWLTGLVLLGVLVLGVQNNLDYVFRVGPAVSHDHVLHSHNHSLPGLWRKLFNPGKPTYTPLLRSSALERIALWGTWSGVIFLLWQTTREERHDADGMATFAVTTVAMVLMSPVAWNHYFLMLLLPIAWLHSRIPSFSWARLGLVCCVAVLWLLPRTIWRWTLIRDRTFGHFDAFDSATGLSIQLYAVIGLLVLCTLEAIGQGRVFEAGLPKRPGLARPQTPPHPSG